MRSDQRHHVAAVVGVQGDRRARAAGEDVGQATDAIDRRLGIAGGDEQVHRSTENKAAETLTSCPGSAWARTAREALPRVCLGRQSLPDRRVPGQSPGTRTVGEADRLRGLRSGQYFGAVPSCHSIYMFGYFGGVAGRRERSIWLRYLTSSASGAGSALASRGRSSGGFGVFRSSCR